MLLDQGFRFDVLDAVLPACGSNPALAYRTVKELTDAVSQTDWLTKLQAYARCVRITRDQKTAFTIDPAHFIDTAEKDLFQALQTCEAQKPFTSFTAFMQAFQPMIPVIDRFFDAVMVMADDETQKANRLGLLQRISSLPKSLVDLSFLEGF
jgi:glycyl-tRNA synthetase beta subunit